MVYSNFSDALAKYQAITTYVLILGRRTELSDNLEEFHDNNFMQLIKSAASA